MKQNNAPINSLIENLQELTDDQWSQCQTIVDNLSQRVDSFGRARIMRIEVEAPGNILFHPKSTTTIDELSQRMGAFERSEIIRTAGGVPGEILFDEHFIAMLMRPDFRSKALNNKVKFFKAVKSASTGVTCEVFFERFNAAFQPLLNLSYSQGESEKDLSVIQIVTKHLKSFRQFLPQEGSAMGDTQQDIVSGSRVTQKNPDAEAESSSPSSEPQRRSLVSSLNPEDDN